LHNAIDKVDNAAETVRNELKREMAMPNEDKPLKPDDFPVNAEGKIIRKQDGAPIAETKDAAASPNVLTRTKPGAKKISGRPDLQTRL